MQESVDLGQENVQRAAGETSWSGHQPARPTPCPVDRGDLSAASSVIQATCVYLMPVLCQTVLET